MFSQHCCPPRPCATLWHYKCSNICVPCCGQEADKPGLINFKISHMKRFFTTLSFALAMLLGMSAGNKLQAQVNVGVNVSYQTFYDELSPYGQWIQYPEYGYVWTPNIGSDFQPYSTGGHWVWSDEYEWIWV